MIYTLRESTQIPWPMICGTPPARKKEVKEGTKTERRGVLFFQTIMHALRSLKCDQELGSRAQRTPQTPEPEQNVTNLSGVSPLTNRNVSSLSVSGDERLFIYFGTVRGRIRVLVLLPGEGK